MTSLETPNPFPPTEPPDRPETTQFPMQSTALVSTSAESGMRTRVVRQPSELESLVPAWQRLAGHCLLKNPCYEPDFLIPLLKHRGDFGARVVVVESVAGGHKSSTLLGLLPIIDRPMYRLPLRCTHAWRPDEAFDSTPLLDAERPEAVFSCLLDSLARSGTRLFSLDTCSGAECFQHVLRSATESTALPIFRRDQFTRPGLKTCENAEAYLKQHTSKNRRKKAKQARRKLDEIGDVAFEHTHASSDFSLWAHAFIDLEASGWKGREGTAIASRNDTLAFFLEMVDRFATRNAIRFGKLTLDAVPIAMIVDICSEDHVSAFKVAFDEGHSEFSPGFLIELENIRWLHESGCRVCDSCTDPNNGLISRLYHDSLDFQSVVIGLDPATRFWTSQAMPLIQKSALLARRIRHLLGKRFS